MDWSEITLLIGVGLLCYPWIQLLSPWVLNQFGHDIENEASALSLIFFFPLSLALLSVWKEVCIYFKSVTLFLLWFVHFSGMGTRLDGEYCLVFASWTVRRSRTLRTGHLEGRPKQHWRGVWALQNCLLKLKGNKLEMQNVQQSSSPLKGMNAATGGNLLSLWTFPGWL